VTIILKFKDGREQAYDALTSVEFWDGSIRFRWWTPISALAKRDVALADLASFEINWKRIKPEGDSAVKQDRKEQQTRPRIITWSTDEATTFEWVSDGWFMVRDRHKPGAKAMYDRARAAIGAADNVVEAIANLEEAGFEVERVATEDAAGGDNEEGSID